MSVYSVRRKRLCEWLEANGVDVMVVASAPNIRYLFGFAGEGVGLVGDKHILSTDRRYELEASAAPGRVTRVFHADGHIAGAVDSIREAKAKRIAFEAEATTYASFEDLDEGLDGVELVACRKVIEELRVIKHKTEIGAIADAAAIMDKALEETIETLRPGCVECEVALDLERRALLGGAEKLAFESIVAFGPSAAHPHAVPSNRKLKSGQMVKIDCGAVIDGYCSDITRTVIIGKPDQQYKEVYAAVYDAQQAALEAAKPGVQCADLDALAREIITERGFGPEFCHGLGHGVGLEVHELPTVGARSDNTLKPGMVITIEPGVYIEGWGGVRIEDTVAVTRSGIEPLTHAAKQPPDL